MSDLIIIVGDYVIVQEGQSDQPKIVVWDDVAVTEFGSLGSINIMASEDVLVQDFSTFLQSLAINIFDAITVREGQLDDSSVPVNVFDAVTVAELATINFNRLRIEINEIVTVADEPVVFSGGPAAAIATDSVLVQEFLALYLLIQINTFDAVQVVDGAWAPDVFEAITVVEDVTIKLARLVIDASDTISVTESVATFGPAIDIGAFTFDEVFATDSATMLLAMLTPSVTEDVTVAESITVSLSSINLTVNVTEDVLVDEAMTVQPNPIQIAEFTEVVVMESVLLINTVLLVSTFDSISVLEDTPVNLSLVLLNVSDDVSVVERVAVRITSAGATGAQMKPLLPVIGAGH